MTGATWKDHGAAGCRLLAVVAKYLKSRGESTNVHGHLSSVTKVKVILHVVLADSHICSAIPKNMFTLEASLWSKQCAWSDEPSSEPGLWGTQGDQRHRLPVFGFLSGSLQPTASWVLVCFLKTGLPVDPIPRYKCMAP